MRGRGEGELPGLSEKIQLYTEAQINFGDITPYLTYAFTKATYRPSYNVCHVGLQHKLNSFDFYIFIVNIVNIKVFEH